MFIPTIILLVLIIALGLWSHHKDEKHNEEINNLKEECRQEKNSALIDLSNSLETYYNREISELRNELSKLKDGTLLEELEYENQSLKNNISSLEDNHEEELRHIEEIHDEEMEESFNKCYEGLIAVENTLKKLNIIYDLHQIIHYHKSLTFESPQVVVENQILTEQIEYLLEIEKD